MIDLTEEQREQLESGKAVDVSDSQSSQQYVILRKDIYERVRHLLYDDSDWTREELLDELARFSTVNGWDEPGMDVYDRYDKEIGNVPTLRVSEQR